MIRRTLAGLLAGGAVAAAVALGACHHPEDFSPTAVADTLVIKPAKSSITADNSSTTDIVATLSSDAAPGRRSVEFTTSTGTFVGSTDPMLKKMTVEAEKGEARVTLKSSNKVEIASIEAKIMNGASVLAAAHTEVQFVAAGLTTIQLTASPTSIPADGFSRTTLVATITSDTPSDRRTVTFTASKGTLVNGTVMNMRSTISVVAGRDNTARAELVSSKSLETSEVTATLDGVTEAVDRVTVRFEAPDPTRLLQISTSATNAPADGQTVVQVTATIAPDTPDADRTVSFTTTAGTFVDSNSKQTSRKADASNKATVDLKADSSIVTALLRATAGVASAETTLPFVRALPDYMIVNLGASTIKADSTTQVAITVDLRRNVGSVTQGTVVTFSAFDANNKEVDLLFRDVKPSDATQTAKANVIAPTGTTPGTVTIKATVKEGSTTITGEEKIVVTP